MEIYMYDSLIGRNEIRVIEWICINYRAEITILPLN